MLPCVALPEGDVTVRVDYSTLNYKDGLAITGKGPVVRKFPMVPGIDLAGTVEASSHAGIAVGDAVVLNGWGVGEGHWGGLAQRARLKGDWLVPLPAAFSPREAMAIGTAGYTAMLCVMALQDQGVRPADGEVLVTGAGGGVGSLTTTGGAGSGGATTGATGDGSGCSTGWGTGLGRPVGQLLGGGGVRRLGREGLHSTQARQCPKAGGSEGVELHPMHVGSPFKGSGC